MTSVAHLNYVAEGFTEDCSMLIRTLTEKYETVDWQKFCKHWKELQFDLMFYNRFSGAELVELTEECLQGARLYMVTETDNFEGQVIGIFIAYAISIIQPYSNLCSLRLAPQDVAPLKKVEAIVRRQNRADVLMILGRLYVNSTHYHVCTRERAMDYGIRKYFDGTIRVPKTIHKLWHGGLDRNDLKNLERISAMEKKYLELQNQIKGFTSEKYSGWRPAFYKVKKPIAGEMAESLRKLIMDSNKEKEKAEKNVDNLKTKAMKNVVNPMRHLSGIQERKAAAVSTPLAEAPAEIQSKQTLQSVRSKIKENSQNVIVGKSLRQYIRPTKNPEPKIQVSEIDGLPSLDNNVIQEPIPVTKVDKEDTAEPPFKGFTAEEIERTNASLSNSDLDGSPNKQPKKKRKNGKQSSTKRRKVSQETTEHNILTKDSKDGLKNFNKFIEKELEPEAKSVANDFVEYKVNDIVIRADQGLPNLEFELIDQYTGPVNNDDMEQPAKTTVDRDISEHDIPKNTSGEIEPMDTVDGSEETVEVVRILSESEADVIETRETLVVPRRKRKRPSLQSKLRRLGILPVANFYNDDVNDS